jgi:fructosamine-3-kinase
LGRGLATIHRFGNENFGFYHNNYCGTTPQKNNWNPEWIDFYGQQRLGYLIGLIKDSGGYGSSELKLFEQLIDKLPELLPPSTPSMIHGDLWAGNYMATTTGPALIDPAACYANREMEMGIMTLFGGFSQRFYDAYNEIYPLPADWKTRNPIYQLYHILNHYYLFGGSYGSQALSIASRFV